MRERAKKIKLVLTDVDGVLTDASMSFFAAPQGGTREIKTFNAYDGIAAHMLRDCGIKSGIITGGCAPATETRAEQLGMYFLYYNCLDKLPALEDVLARTGLKAEETAFIGDDLIDIPVLRRVGLAVCVANARKEARDVCHIVLETEGGKGAFRDACEIVLKAQGYWTKTLKNAYEGNIGLSKKEKLAVTEYSELKKRGNV
jgi:YrbI family 3-deoxy-D-manno-octulosonate 8-phosphate phosphatase